MIWKDLLGDPNDLKELSRKYEFRNNKANIQFNPEFFFFLTNSSQFREGLFYPSLLEKIGQIPLKWIFEQDTVSWGIDQLIVSIFENSSIYLTIIVCKILLTLQIIRHFLKTIRNSWNECLPS